MTEPLKTEEHPKRVTGHGGYLFGGIAADAAGSGIIAHQLNTGSLTGRRTMYAIVPEGAEKKSVRKDGLPSFTEVYRNRSAAKRVAKSELGNQRYKIEKVVLPMNSWILPSGRVNEYKKELGDAANTYINKLRLRLANVYLGDEAGGLMAGTKTPLAIADISPVNIPKSKQYKKITLDEIKTYAKNHPERFKKGVRGVGLGILSTATGGFLLSKYYGKDGDEMNEKTAAISLRGIAKTVGSYFDDLTGANIRPLSNSVDSAKRTWNAGKLKFQMSKDRYKKIYDMPYDERSEENVIRAFAERDAATTTNSFDRWNEIAHNLLEEEAERRNKYIHRLYTRAIDYGQEARGKLRKLHGTERDLSKAIDRSKKARRVTAYTVGGAAVAGAGGAYAQHEFEERKKVASDASMGIVPGLGKPRALVPTTDGELVKKTVAQINLNPIAPAPINKIAVSDSLIFKALNKRIGTIAGKASDKVDTSDAVRRTLEQINRNPLKKRMGRATTMATIQGIERVLARR